MILSRFKNEKIIYLIIILNIILAVVALFKDIFLARHLGTGQMSDSLFIAFLIPDAIGNNLIAVALGISMLPVLSKINIYKSKIEFTENIYTLLSIIAVSISILIFVLFIFRNSLVNFMGYGLSEETLNSAKLIFVLFLPLMLLYPLITVGGIISNIKGSFLIPAGVPIIFNFIFLCGILFSMYKNSINNNSLIYISGSILVGVFIMAAILWGNIFKSAWINLNFKVKKFYKNSIIKEFLKIFIPYFIILGVFQFVFVFERFFASQVGEGAVSALNYAFRISQIPIWIFVAAISTYIMPELAYLKNKNNNILLKKKIIQYIKLNFAIVIPIIIAIQVLREPLIRILFFGNNFDDTSLIMTSEILSGYAFAIFGHSIFMIGTRILIAIKKIKFLVFSTILSSSIIVLLNYLTLPKIGIKAIGISAAIGSTINGLLIILYMIYIINLKDYERQGV